MAQKKRRDKGTGAITKISDPARKAKYRASFQDDLKKKRYKFFETEKEAKAFLSSLATNKKLRNEILNSHVITFSKFVENVFLPQKEKENMKPSAYVTLKANAEKVCAIIGNIPLSEVDSDIVQQMLFTLAEKGYAGSRLIKWKLFVGAVLKMAAAKHAIDTVPTIDVTIPKSQNQYKEKQAKNNWLRKNELIAYEIECKRTYFPKKYTKYYGKELMVHVAGYRLLFLLHTGLRVGECLALTWDDYDEYSKTIIIDKNMVYVNSQKIVQYSTKTQAGERVIVLNRQAFNDLVMLRKQFDEQTQDLYLRMEEEIKAAEDIYSGAELKSKKREIKDKYKKYHAEHKYICGSTSFPYGSAGSAGTGQTHRKICKAINLNHTVNVHGLRHSYVTHYYLRHKNDSDFDLATFSKMIGHSSIRTTMEIYAHLEMTENRHVERSVEVLKDF